MMLMEIGRNRAACMGYQFSPTRRVPCLPRSSPGAYVLSWPYAMPEDRIQKRALRSDRNAAPVRKCTSSDCTILFFVVVIIIVTGLRQVQRPVFALETQIAQFPK